MCEITYGQQLSFVSIEELSSYLPQNYEILTFNTRKLDGSKDKRKGSLAKRSGFMNYFLSNTGAVVARTTLL